MGFVVGLRRFWLIIFLEKPGVRSRAFSIFILPMNLGNRFVGVVVAA